MATVTDQSASTPEAPDAKADQKKCSTRDLIKEISDEVTAAKLEKEISSQKVTALEEHLKQLQTYDGKISTAADDYEKGIGAVCKDFGDLRAAVEKDKTQYQCLVKEDARTKIAQLYDALRHRRETLETCTWELSQRALDKQCDLDHGKAQVSRDEKNLDESLARLDLRKKEVTNLKDIKEIVDCSDAFTKECRYAFYLDLAERLKIDCPTADDYMCELVDQVKELDKTRQRVRDMEKEVRVVEDQLDRVTKLRDDLVAGWRDELCRAVTAGSVAPLPPDIATACANGKPAPTTGTPANEAPESNAQQQGAEKPNGEQGANPEGPPQAQGA